MNTLEDLFNSQYAQFADSGSPHSNPFLASDVLSGAQILEVRYDGIRSALAIVLEMRLAEREWQASSGLLVASNVSGFSWLQDVREQHRTAWTILSSTSIRKSSGLSFQLSGSPIFTLNFTSQSATFYSARIETLESIPPPDYTEDDLNAIREGIPRWNSIVKDVRVVHCP